VRVSLECVSAGDLEVRLEPEVSVPVGLRRLDAVDGGPLVAGAVVRKLNISKLCFVATWEES